MLFICKTNNYIPEPNFEDNDLTINSLEWEDPLHKNRLNQREMRRFNLLLTQIALIINRKKLILRPYFQEHELVANSIESKIYYSVKLNAFINYC